MSQSFMELFEEMIRNVRGFFRALFNNGMRRPNPNHLHGRRRLYASPASMANIIQGIMSKQQSFLKVVGTELYSVRELMILAAVVDSEVRFNVYRVDFDESNHHRVGEIDLFNEGIATFLVSPLESEMPHSGKLSCQPVHQPLRHKRYNPYQVEISWTVPLLDLNEGFLHTSSFAVQEC